MTNVLIIQLKWDLKITPFSKEKTMVEKTLSYCFVDWGPVEFTLLETTSKNHREHFTYSNVIQDSNTKICFKLFTIPLYTSIKMKKQNVKKLSVRVRDILIPDTFESRRNVMNRLSKNFDTTILNKVSNSFIFSFRNTENINTFSILFISFFSSSIIYFFNIYYRKLTLADSPCRLLRK